LGSKSGALSTTGISSASAWLVSKSIAADASARYALGLETSGSSSAECAGEEKGAGSTAASSSATTGVSFATDAGTAYSNPNIGWASSAA